MHEDDEDGVVIHSSMDHIAPEKVCGGSKVATMAAPKETSHASDKRAIISSVLV